ncbi:MAG TPA: PIN domain-containing protein [archaeon]|nr:PIN domain-containing protein [archaeon]
MTLPFFLDTSVLVAYFAENDSQHEKAVRELQKTGKEETMVSDYVLDEFLTVLFSKTKSKPDCEKAYKELTGNTQALIVAKEAFNAAEALFFQGNRLSFTDCTTLYFCKKHGFKLVTFDGELSKLST